MLLPSNGHISWVSRLVKRLTLMKLKG